MAPDAAAALLGDVAAAVCDGALPYALALAWERDGAAAWAACVDVAQTVWLATLVDPAAGARGARAAVVAACALALAGASAATTAVRTALAAGAHGDFGAAAADPALAAAVSDGAPWPHRRACYAVAAARVLAGPIPDERRVVGEAADATLGHAAWVVTYARAGVVVHQSDAAWRWPPEPHLAAALALLAPAVRAALGAPPTLAHLTEAARGPTP